MLFKKANITGVQSTFRRILALILPNRRQLAVGFFSLLVVTGTDLSVPKLFGDGLIGRILGPGGNPQLLPLMIMAIIALSLLRALFSFTQSYNMSYLGHRVIANLRQRIFVHLERLSIAYHETHKSGETIARVLNDVALIQNMISVNLVDLVMQTVLLIGAMVMIFVTSWRLALVTLVIGPLIVIVVSVISRQIHILSHLVQQRVAGISVILHEALAGIRVIKAFGLEKHETERFGRENEAGFQANLRSARALAVLMPTVQLFFMAGLALIFWFGSSEVLRGNLQLGGLVTFFGYVAIAGAPMTGLSRSFAFVQQGIAAGDRVFELLDQDVELQEAPDAITVPALTGRVEFRGVDFAYQSDQPILTDINLCVNAGTMVALVGPSGAGKTSLVNLIPRFYDPWDGSVLVDGYDLRMVKTASLRAQIGLVPQETVLFGVSVLENIAHGRLDAAEEEIIAAAQAANAHDFITALPDGYRTILGERGASLSGGQRQRIAIARAILRNPPILILDEATSSLDAESESLVQSALERLMRGRTTFVIAHRLSTILHADQIVVLDQGALAEQGTHEELLTLGGVYARLYERQLAVTGHD